MNRRDAIRATERYKIILIYPSGRERDPPSLWSVAYPRAKLRWEWDETGDDRVASLWYLKEELSRSRQVVYTKWYKGKATLLSRQAFTCLLALYLHARLSLPPLSRDAAALLELLRENSPLSTKELKKGAGLQGKLLESTYVRAMRELWTRLWVVAFGEVDDGAFPSLAIGASDLLFEELFRAAQAMPLADARAFALSVESPRVREFLRKSLGAAGTFLQNPSSSPGAGFAIERSKGTKRPRDRR